VPSSAVPVSVIGHGDCGRLAALAVPFAPHVTVVPFSVPFANPLNTMPLQVALKDPHADVAVWLVAFHVKSVHVFGPE